MSFMNLPWEVYKTLWTMWSFKNFEILKQKELWKAQMFTLGGARVLFQITGGSH